MNLPKIIDNKRKTLLEVLQSVSKDHNQISIATGYWDIEGMARIIDSLESYQSIRILIGREPLLKRDNTQKIQEPEPDYPDKDFFQDLKEIEPTQEMRDIVIRMKSLIDRGALEVRVYRKTFLHAKCYIFGSYDSENAVGIIGSSNFTKNGMMHNTELNALESDHRVVVYKPQNEKQEVGHLTWFDEMWSDEKTEVWTGQFIELIRQSPVGDLCPSPYEMYIRTLYYLFEDEIASPLEISQDVQKVLYAFQQRNARLLINKLEKHNLAMLADSVGLGKTITAGAVIKEYIEKQGYKRINIIVPAKLVSQWQQDLASVHNLVQKYDILSMQDMTKIEQHRKIDRYAPVDLFVIDEAHNLRNSKGERHKRILEWLSDNPKSKVLLLTATPINNQLEDFVSQIQLASKGRLTSFPIVFNTKKKNEVIDFFEAVRRLSTELKQDEKEGKDPDWKRIHRVMRQGLRQFLVRSTRSGIEKEFGGLMDGEGKLHSFPKGEVLPRGYNYSEKNDRIIYEILQSHKESSFEGIALENINQDKLLEVTQRTKHPLDIIREGEKDIFSKDGSLDVFVLLFRVLLTLGFTPYKTETYRREYYGKDIETIRNYELSEEKGLRLRSHLSIHNMLRVGLLKRLESSPYALRQSLEMYEKKIDMFTEYLEKGYIMSFQTIADITKEYGEDANIEEFSEEKKEDFEKADNDYFCIEELKKDIERDRKIIAVLTQACKVLEKEDDKIASFVSLLKELEAKKINGGKVLIFSFYADTITYLSEKISQSMGEEWFKKSSFVSGGNSQKDIEKITERFAPKAKKYECPEDEELQYLFATDVLSEGQNLQDCGVIINFDLHWNPVRMIQRNGRINRLGSLHSKIFVYNMHPEEQLEAYLKLVKRLEGKIERIRRSIGTDQSVLGEKENPIEYVENLYSEKATEYIEKLEDDEGFLSEDEYIFDLRKFLETATEEEQENIKKIPEGKWGYYPESQLHHAEKTLPQTLSLVRVGFSQGKKTDIFVSSNGGEEVEPRESLEVLSFIRTNSEDTEKKQDTFSYNKSRIRELTEAQAGLEAGREKEKKVKSSEIPVFEELAKTLPGRQFFALYQSIKTKQRQDTWNKIVRDVNKEIKQHGQILRKTIQECDTFYKEYEEEIKTATPTMVVDKQSLLTYGK